MAKGTNRASLKLNERLDPQPQHGKCIFISHQKQDRDIAEKIAVFLMDNGIDVYFDEMDPNAVKAGENNDNKGIVEAITKGIKKSTNMLCIISKNTQHSKWVPFEIGYGYEKKPFVLLMGGVKVSDLPEYLQIATILPVISEIVDFENHLVKLEVTGGSRMINEQIISDLFKK